MPDHDDPIRSPWSSRHGLARAALALACGAIVLACSSFDPGLLDEQSDAPDDPSEQTGDAGVNGPDAGGGSGAGGGSAGGSGSGSAGRGGMGGSGGSGHAGMGGSAGAGSGGECELNSDPLAQECPLICPESCNGEDDDCDGAVDEGDMTATCALDHAMAACLAGACRIVECMVGHRDCDRDADTGCETAPDDVMHCGQCDRACDLPNAIAACVSGECVAVGCDGLYGDCDDEPNDCETQLTALDNCAVCGIPCGDLPNATATCEQGFCGPGACAMDYGDCNGAPGDGCEQTLDTLEHCGGCHTACALPGAGEDCSTGVCLETGCDSGHADCDGDPTDGCDSLSSSAHCGGCNAACDTTLDNVSNASCAAEQCALQCVEGYGDCDADPSTGCETQVTTLSRCGACDTPCAIPHAEVSCDLGTCTFVRCETGWDDCNDDLALDGCETSLNADTSCGGCDVDCTMTADPVCSGGQCSDLVCPDPGTADCDQDGLTCEVDLQSDVDHCGACNAACAFTTASPNASGLVCQTGSCKPVCAPGFGDCNGDYRDGCETAVNTLANCGSCGATCAIANASETCASGSCEVDVCASDWADCNMDDLSCETQLGTVSDCSGCGMACELDNAVPSCTGPDHNRHCEISACSQTYYENCDGVTDNGCEVDKRSDAAHCGACGNACDAHANVLSATCSSSSCNYTCQSGWGDCTSAAGCETALDTNSDCGGCGITCSRTNGSASCSTGTCELTGCNAGYDDCNGNANDGCEPLDTLQNCGSCGTPCLITNGNGTCGTGTCVVASCNDGWDDCDGDPANGCERDVDPPNEGGQGPCQPDAGCTEFAYGGRAYYFCATDRTWTDARGRCQLQLLGDLVHVDDADEDGFVRSHLGADAWIGAHDSAEEGVWRWANDGVQFWMGTSSGSALAYENWNTGEPNDYMGDEDCAEIHQTDGLWNDQSCTITRDFVCEVQADVCPDDPDKASPGQCGCGNPDTDTDSDGTADCNDGCVSDPNKTSPGQCGCGNPDTDSDTDGTADCDDGCVSDPNKTSPGQCGCGNSDTDSDADGTADCNDACPSDGTRTVAPCGFNYTPSNFDPAGIDFAAAPNTTLNCGTTTIDTSGTGAPTITNWCGSAPSPVLRSQSGGPGVVILPLQGLTVNSGNTLRLIGARPVILAISGSAAIHGTISARGVGATPGAGGNVSCSSGTGANGGGDSGSNDGDGGGGGGGFGSSGGSGGAGDSGGGAGGSAGATEGNTTLVPLRGGCRGGIGGYGGAGGAGGGAVQISATGTVTVSGTGIVSASGGGGLAGNYDEEGGGGGGSGGAVLLEADGIAMQSGGWVSANGGGGASGSASDEPSSKPGTDGYQSSTSRAPGGPGGRGGGAGGYGAASSGAASSGAEGYFYAFYLAGGGGGGGGGGVGRIRVRGVSSCSLNGTMTPGASTSCP